MNRLEEISKRPLMRHMRILLPSVDFLLRAVEQLANIAKIASSPEYEDGEWNFLTAIDGLEPDIRELINA